MENQLTQVIAVLAFVVSIVTAWVGICQFRLAKRRLHAWEEAVLGQNTLSLMEYMHRPEYRDARNVVCSPGFAGHEEDAIMVVCSHFDYAGVIVRHGMVSRKIFFDYWGDNLKTISKSVSEFMSKEQNNGQTGHQNWKDFSWLMEIAEKGYFRSERIDA